MAEDDSPALARRNLRLRLREARDNAKLTQQEVAERMEWSQSKVIRIENGDVRIAPNDLRPLLTLLNVRDKSEVAELLALAKVARTRQPRAWYQAPELREHFTDAMLRLIEYEAEADEIRNYQVFFLPGPLQTTEYAKALLANFEDDIPAATQRIRVQSRKRRREQVLARLDSLKVYTLLDESVFLRELGGPEVFVSQLKDLHELASTGRINVRMIPFEDYPAVTNNATFDLLTLRAGDPHSDVLYRETGLQDEIMEGASVTRRHRERFDKIWRSSANEVDTIDFMRERIKNLEEKIQNRSTTYRRPT